MGPKIKGSGWPRAPTTQTKLPDLYDTTHATERRRGVLTPGSPARRRAWM